MTKSIQSREKTANFIHNVAEMEKQVYILTETRKKCILRGQTILKNAEHKKSNAEKAKQTAEYEYNRSVAYTKKAINQKNKPDDFRSILKRVKESFFGIFEFAGEMWSRIHINISNAVLDLVLSALLLCVILGYFLVIPIMIFEWFGNMISRSVDLSDVNYIIVLSLFLISMTIPWIIATAIFYVRNLKYEKKMKNIEVNNCQSIEKKRAQALSDRKNNLDFAMQEYTVEMKQVDLLMKQAKICSDAAKKINAVLRKCYEETNIVKEDFRYIDCVIILDFAFRNDLVDTVREGINYYETKVFRNSVIKGMNNICSRLNELTYAVNGLRADLSMIELRINDLNTNAGEIIEGLSKTVSQQSDMLNVQKQVLSDTKATRYATESINDSVKRLNNYYGVL